MSQSRSYEFISVVICWISWMLISCFSLNLGSFQSSFLQIFSAFVFLSSAARPSIMHLLVYLMVFHRFLRLCLLFLKSFFFLFVSFNNFHCLISDSFFCLLAEVCLWLHLLNFPCSYYIFQHHYFWFILVCLFIYWYFHFVHTLFSWLCLHFSLILWVYLRLWF